MDFYNSALVLPLRSQVLYAAERLSGSDKARDIGQTLY